MTDITFKIIFAPNARHKAGFEDNLIDIEAGINPAWRKSSAVSALYSTPFAQTVDVMLFKAENFVQVKSSNDLIGKQIGTVRGYSYPMFTRSFDNEEIERIDLKDGASLLKFFAAGRIDYILINKTVAEYWMLNYKGDHNFMIGNPISSTDVMLRIHPSKKHLVSQINGAIETLISSGEIEKIYAQYR